MMNRNPKYSLFVFLILLQLKAHSQEPKVMTVGIGVPLPMIKVVINNEIKQTAGYPEWTRGVSRVNIIYNYDNMGVCDYPNENAYLEHKREKYNEKKHREFLEKWSSMRKSNLEPGFESYFNKYIVAAGISAKNNFPQADITLRIEVLYIEPEDHRLKTSTPPYISIIGTFLNNEDMIARYELKSYGSRENNMTDRLTECFKIAGKMLAKEIVKGIKKAEKSSKSEQ